MTIVVCGNERISIDQARVGVQHLHGKDDIPYIVEEIDKWFIPSYDRDNSHSFCTHNLEFHLK
jgi:hypothetical protein